MVGRLDSGAVPDSSTINTLGVKMFNWIKNYFDKWVKKEEERQIRYLSGKGK
tara:strand:+ start:8036 stop:8191 length:156 start_codon:yes stop_codon:yes gene_type:complete